MDFSGFIAYNFLVEKELVPKNSYRLTVKRDGIVSVSSVATIPGITEVSVVPQQHVGCTQNIEFIFKNVEYPERILMEVGIIDADGIQWSGFAAGPKPKHRIEDDEMVLIITPRNLLTRFFTPSNVNTACQPHLPFNSIDYLSPAYMKMMQLKYWVFIKTMVVLLLFASQTNVFAQAGQATLRVLIIIEEDGTPVIGATVFISEPGADTLRAGVTNTDGFADASTPTVTWS